MKRKRRLSAEQIRYYVPGIKSRFLGVHKNIVLVCITVVAVVITFYAAYLSVTSAAITEARIIIVIFCEVDDIDEAVNRVDIFKYTYDVHFARYEEELRSEDADIPYDLSTFGTNVQARFKALYSEDLFGLIVYASRNSILSITYSGIGIKPDVLTGEQVVQILRDTYENLYLGV